MVALTDSHARCSASRFSWLISFASATAFSCRSPALHNLSVARQQRECEERHNESGCSCHEAVLGINPIDTSRDGAVSETLSKALAFFGTLLVFLLLFALTRSKR